MNRTNLTLTLDRLKMHRKSLADKARETRKQERKYLTNARKTSTGNWDPTFLYEQYENLHNHRTVDIRLQARAAHLAHHFLKGHEFAKVETAPVRAGKDTQYWNTLKYFAVHILKVIREYYPFYIKTISLDSVIDWILGEDLIPHEYEIKILKEIMHPGTQDVRWGAAMGQTLEFLRSKNAVTGWNPVTVTDKGRLAVLRFGRG